MFFALDIGLSLQRLDTCWHGDLEPRNQWRACRDAKLNWDDPISTMGNMVRDTYRRVARDVALVTWISGSTAGNAESPFERRHSLYRVNMGFEQGGAWQRRVIRDCFPWTVLRSGVQLMPYTTIRKSFVSVLRHLSTYAQEIYRGLNNAWCEYADRMEI